ALLHVRPLGFTDFIASAGTAQWGQVTRKQLYTFSVTIHQPSFFAHLSTGILSSSRRLLELILLMN
ncbi:hypothetical protein VDS10_05940, partial [Xanthomonas campestris pv. campestris]|nr:hypothetical protein [Xanthomonas campestris pv. campestris]